MLFYICLNIKNQQIQIFSKNYFKTVSFILKTMNYNNQELQAFLIEADLINQKVKALAQNRMSSEEFDHLERLRQQDKQRRQQAKRQKQQSKIKKVRQGRQGKGITKDFKNFCYFCRWQYQFQTPTCLKCKKKTMTLEQRQKQLQIMVGDYKYKKKNRQERKHKWDMWQKTQASLWKKNSTNYSKWEYFVSDSQQQVDKQPIVPKNDPNFLALQADLQQRKKRKQKDHQQTQKLKQKGNKLMKQGNYEEAMHKYTLALQHAKDVKSVYTNRALAYIKLRKYKKAIKDCTNVIQYMQIFEKIGQNKDLTFKAYSRRAIARKQIKQYKLALQDIKQGLKLFPQDKNGLLLKKQLQGLSLHVQNVQKLLRENTIKVNPQKSQSQTKTKEQNIESIKQPSEKDQQMQQQLDEQSIKLQQKRIVKQLAQMQIQERNNQQQKQQKQKIHQQQQQTKQQQQNKNKNSNSNQNKNKNQHIKQTVVEVKQKQIQLNPIQQIKKNVQQLNAQTIKQTFELFVKDKNMVTIFIAAKGIQASLKSLLSSEFSNQEALLISLCLDGSGVAQKSVWDFGVDKLHERLTQLLDDKTNQKQHIYQMMEDIFEILIAISLYEPYRIKLSNDNKVYSFIEQTYTKLISKKKSRTHLLNLFAIYLSNLLSGSDSGLKNSYFTKQKVITLIDSLYVFILDENSQNRIFLDLKKNVYGLIANLVSHSEHRRTIIEFLSTNNKFNSLIIELQQYPKSMHNFTQFIEAILSVFVNISFETSLQLPYLADALFSRFIKFRKEFSKEIVYRSLLILSRIKIQNPQIGKKWLQIFQQISLDEQPLKNPAQKCNMAQVIKILNILYTPSNGVMLTAQIPKKLFEVMSKYISDNLVHQNLFCNTANLFGVIAMSNLPFKQKVYEQVSLSMKQLVFISKEKIGNWRKNAAILIAKCSSNLKCKEAMEKQHAMDVLKSIAHLISGK